MFNRKLPLWYQLSQVLRSRILSGELRQGDQLSPEVQLAREYKVSIVTVRQALKTLETERLITRHRGRGTFVSRPSRAQAELKALGSVETLIAQQFSEETVLLAKGLVPTPPNLVEVFGGLKEVFFFKRLRQSGAVPLSYAINYAPAEYGAQVGEEALRRFPMLKIWRDVLGVELKEVKLSVEAVAADYEIAQLLHVNLLSPVLHFTGIASDAGGRTVDVAEIRYRADRFKFSVDFYISGDKFESRGTPHGGPADSSARSPAAALHEVS